MRQLLKYPGSKFRTAEWIISHFPEHHSYLEPFFGSGGVFFNKPPSRIEAINDLDNDVVNLFEVIRDYPEELAEAVFNVPYARSVFDCAFLQIPQGKIDRAVNFLVRNNMGHGFRTTGEKVGFKTDVQGREYAYAVRYWNNLPGQILEAAIRLKDAQIENRSVFSLLERYNHPNVLIYADPPYVLSTRFKKQYKHEFTEQDHIRLLEMLKQHKGYVVISGYDTELYNKMLEGWNTDVKSERAQNSTHRIEKIWMNF